MQGPCSLALAGLSVFHTYGYSNSFEDGCLTCNRKMNVWPLSLLGKQISLPAGLSWGDVNVGQQEAPVR